MRPRLSLSLVMKAILMSWNYSTAHFYILIVTYNGVVSLHDPSV